MRDEEFDILLAGAEDELNCAKGLLQMGFLRGTVNHCYYSYFNTVRALLVLQNEYAKTHNGIHTLFAKYYIHTEKISKDFLTNFGKLQGQRISAEYELYGDYDKEDIISFIKMAEDFLEHVKTHFQ
jgi:uncharacterized protein (UPF0332 family)